MLFLMFQAGPQSFVQYQNYIVNVLANDRVKPIGTAIMGVAMGVLAVAALVGVYEALFDGGNLRAAATTMIKYIITAFVLSHWTALFTDMCNNMAGITGSFITAGSGTADSTQDIYYATMASFRQYWQNTGDGLLTIAWNAVTGQALMLVLTAVTNLVEQIAYLFFCIWFIFWGLILWGVGPLIVALLPSQGLGKYATHYLSRVGEWVLWPVLYAILGAIMVALNLNTADNVFNTSATTDQQAQQLLVIIVTLALSVALCAIPFTAKSLIAGEFSAVGGAVLGIAKAAAGMAMGAHTSAARSSEAAARAAHAGDREALSDSRYESGQAHQAEREAIADSRWESSHSGGSGGGRLPPPESPAHE